MEIEVGKFEIGFRCRGFIGIMAKVLVLDALYRYIALDAQVPIQ